MISMKKTILTSTFLIAAVLPFLFSGTLACANDSVAIWSMSSDTKKYCPPVVVANSNNEGTIKGALIDLDTGQRVHVTWYLTDEAILDYFLDLDDSPYFDTKFPDNASLDTITQCNEVTAAEESHTIKVVVRDASNTILASDDKSYEIADCSDALTLGPPSAQCLGLPPNDIPGNFEVTESTYPNAAFTDESGTTSSVALSDGSFDAIDLLPDSIKNNIFNTEGFHYLRLDAPINSNLIYVSSTVPFNIQPCIYYVDIDDGSNDNAGTAAAPWRTLHYSLSTIESGTLNVAAGNYKIGNNLETNTPITISNSDITVIGEGDAAIGASNPTAVIDGTGGGGSTEWNSGFTITGSNVTIKGISIKNFSTTDESGIEITGGTGNKVRDCKISDNYAGITIANSNTFKVQDCEIYSNTKYGLSVETSTGGEIHRNTIYYHHAEDNEWGVYVKNCSPSIKRNKIYDNQMGIWVLSSAGTVSPDIFNNVIYETEDYTMTYGIRISCNGGTASPTIYHNSIDGGSGDGIAILWGNCVAAAPVIKYNIITRCDDFGINANNANITCNPDYNDIWHNGPNGRGLAADNYNGCNPGANDLYEGDGLGKDPENGTAGPLAASSLCRNAIPTTNPPGDPVTMDYLGYKRPVGSGYDMGAYEYVAQQTYKDTLPGGTGVVTDYRIFTIPLDIGTGLDMKNTMEGVLGTYDQTRWRVFARTTSGDVEMNTEAFKSLDLKSGIGLWGITVLTNAIDFTGTLAPDDIYYEMKLAPGWHLIAVPWPNPSIQLDNIYVTDGVNQYAITDSSNTLTQQKIWDYTGGYTERSTGFSLATGTGYYIKVLGSSNINLSIPPNNSSDPPNNNSASTSHAVSYESLESVRLADDSEPPPLPGGPYGPVPDIRANGKSGTVTVSRETPVSITVSLDPGDQVDKDADWWVAAHTPFDAPLNWYSYVYPEGWRPGIYPCAQIPLFQVTPSFEVLNTTLPPGHYTFHFAVDENADGIVDETWKDSVDVRVE
jgi:parallel beta-helix repeat protein